MQTKTIKVAIVSIKLIIAPSLGNFTFSIKPTLGLIAVAYKTTAKTPMTKIQTEVLAVGGDKLTIGTPTVSGAKVEASVVSCGKAKKVVVYKYKPKKGFHKKNGHRQAYTEVKIEKITA